jgi:hypothetical protein
MQLQLPLPELTHKALSIRQPHIDRILEGYKTLEIRSWRTHYRGAIILCASQSSEDCKNDDHRNLLRGHALGIAFISDVFEFKLHHSPYAITNWKPNHFCWELSHVTKIKPFPIKGKLGLFNIVHPFDKIFE